MAITRPVSRTTISTVGWGIPITDEVNRLTDATAVTPWANCTLQNGWTVYGTFGARYRKVGDMVHLFGGVTGGTITSTITILPAGFRPAIMSQFVGASYAPNVANLEIGTDGVLWLYAGDVRFIGFNIIFPLT